MSDYYFSIPLYHVDLKENNELFIEGKNIPPSNEDGEWGGKGLYLWDNLKNAEYWKRVHWKNDWSKASIVKTVLMKSARKSPYFNAGMDRAYRL